MSDDRAARNVGKSLDDLTSALDDHADLLKENNKLLGEANSKIDAVFQLLAQVSQKAGNAGVAQTILQGALRNFLGGRKGS